VIGILQEALLAIMHPPIKASIEDKLIYIIYISLIFINVNVISFFSRTKQCKKYGSAEVQE
jgi:hypothetical protein